VSVESELSRVLTVPLDELVDRDVQVRIDPVVDQWLLPWADRRALLEWGLPQGLLVCVAPQLDALPTLVPNPAGELERNLISADQRLYLLGSYGDELVTPDGEDLTVWIGVVAGDGRVLGIRSRPVTTLDMHPQLREYYADLYHPSVCPFGSSVAAFVEVAWRWHAASEVIYSQPEPPPSAGADAGWAHHVGQRRACEQMLVSLAAFDPALAVTDPRSLWVDEITPDRTC
jgi:hypothetical protein